MWWRCKGKTGNHGIDCLPQTRTDKHQQFRQPSMNPLSKIIEKYAAFETAVRVYSSKISRHHCSACNCVCCKPEYCAETLTSLFLRRLRQRCASDAVYSEGRGWLTPTGCALPVGRPPVCYQFFCRKILDVQPTAQCRYAIAILANLVGHVGKKACRNQHIVELDDAAQLQRINLSRFEKQLDEAVSAFDLVCAYLDGKTAELSDSPVLTKISTAPHGLFPKRSCHAPARFLFNRASRRRQKCAFLRI